jgi:flagellar basal-body rod protein FlgB
MSDVTLDAITSALTGLSERQRVIADNTANINTYNFLAGRVQFEDSLQQALSSGSSPDVTPTVSRSLDPTGPDGNNVSLDQETLLGIETTLRFQLMLHAADDKFAQLRDVLRGS